MPAVSVLMAVRDGARFLDEAVASVLHGTGDDVELVAVDDASTDATPAILSRWARRDERVRVVTLDRPAGAATACNRGLGVARGEFVTPHDGDDVYVPARLERQTRALRADPGAVLVAGAADVIDARGRRLFTQRFAECPEVVAHTLLLRNPLVHGAVMYRRAAAQAAGGYPDGILGSYDYALWLRLASQGRLLAAPEVASRYRWHPGQTTVVHGGEQRHQSIANSHGAVIGALGHEPDPGAFAAAAHVARETGQLCDAAAAGGLFAALLEGSPHAGDPAFRRRVGALTAERFVAHASRLALGGHVGAALAALRQAVRWDPRGPAGTAALAARRIGWLAAVRWRERT